MGDILPKLLDWLERVLPGLIGAFIWGLRTGQDGKRNIEIALIKSKLELECLKNAEKIMAEWASKSDDDVIDTALGNGAEFGAPDTKPSGEK